MFIGRTTFPHAVTSVWSPAGTDKYLATATLDGGVVGFDDEEAVLAVHQTDLVQGCLTQY